MGINVFLSTEPSIEFLRNCALVHIFHYCSGIVAEMAVEYLNNFRFWLRFWFGYFTHTKKIELVVKYL